jgi:hypothetical protein
MTDEDWARFESIRDYKLTEWLSLDACCPADSPVHSNALWQQWLSALTAVADIVIGKKCTGSSSVPGFDKEVLENSRIVKLAWNILNSRERCHT